MSKRYGRNQKRKARERIASLQETLVMEAALRASLQRDRARLQSVLDRALRVLPRLTTALPPQDLTTRLRETTSSFQMSAQRPVPQDVLNRDSTTQIETLHILLTHIEAAPQPDRLGRAMHCRVQLRDGRWAYAISDEALATMPPEDLERDLMLELAQQFAREFREAYAQRRHGG